MSDDVTVLVAAFVLGAVVVGVSVALIVVGRVPSGTIRTGGYGADIWAGLTGVYAAGLPFATLPLLPASIVAGAAVAVAVIWSLQAPWIRAAATAGALIVAGVVAGLLTIPSRWLAGIVVGLAAAGATALALRRLVGDAETSARLPAFLRRSPLRVAWVVVVGLAAGTTAAAPAEETGVLLLLAGVCAAATFVMLARQSREHPGASLRATTWAGLVAAAVPPVLAFVDLFDGDGAHPVLWLAVPTVLVTIVVVVQIVFREVLGPFDRQAARSPLPYGTGIRWVWVGGVSDDSATIVVRPREDGSAGDVTLLVRPGDVEFRPQSAPHGVARVHLDGLQPDTDYEVTVALHGDDLGQARFRTFGPRRGRTVRIAMASCASTGSNAKVFDTIAGLGPDVFCQLGDLHYENIGRDDPGRFRRAFDDALSSPALARMMSRVPMSYVFDDHDFGKNNSDRDSRSKHAVWRVYRERVAHHELPDDVTGDGGPVHQRFQVGPVLVVVTDTRSEREPDDDRAAVAGEPRRLIGADQERWLLGAPAEAARLGCTIVLWCTSAPWIGEDGADADTWSGFPEQRRRIADALLAAEAEHGVRVVAASGDAHMVGLDAGVEDRAPGAGPAGARTPTTGADATAWQARVFPAMNAAALDRRGSHKGASYGHFERPGAGHFGVVEVDVDDEGRATGLTLRVHDSEREIAHLPVPLPPPGRS